MDSNKSASDRLVLVLAPVSVCAVVYCAARYGSIGLSVKKDFTTLVPGIFGTMMLLALFVERVIEVFVSIWSDQQTSVHQQSLAYWTARGAKLRQDVSNLMTELNGAPPPSDARKATIATLLDEKRQQIEAADDNADTERKALIPVKVRTRKMSTWIGLVVGTLTAAVGFRFLAQMLDVAPLTVAGAGVALQDQYDWFVAVDVLLTGTVLAGGSKLVHQIFSVYSAFTRSLQQAAVAKGNTQ